MKYSTTPEDRFTLDFLRRHSISLDLKKTNEPYLVYDGWMDYTKEVVYRVTLIRDIDEYYTVMQFDYPNPNSRHNEKACGEELVSPASVLQWALQNLDSILFDYAKETAFNENAIASRQTYQRKKNAMFGDILNEYYSR